MKNKLIYIIDQIDKYLEKYKIENVIIGNSGGIDSALCIAILSKCKCNVISRYIHIETNKADEQKRAEMIAKAFNVNHKSINLDHSYYNLAAEMSNCEDESVFTKIQLGNIKARLRMIYLYNLAHVHNGIVVSTDNKTERELGFFTLHAADEGDIVPLFSLYKSEVYKMAELMTNSEDFLNPISDELLLNDDQSLALIECIKANPTDGLGISNSDLDQLGAKSYEEVDLSLMSYKSNGCILNENVIKRHLNTEFKRNHPYIIDSTHIREEIS